MTHNQVKHVLLAASWNLAFPESVPGVGVAGGIVLCKYEGLLLGFCLCPELVGMGEHGLTQQRMPKQRPGRMEVQDALGNYFWGQEAGRERISGCVDELACSCRCKRLRGTKDHSPSPAVPTGYAEARYHDPAGHRAVVCGVTAHPDAGEAHDLGLRATFQVWAADMWDHPLHRG